MRSILKENEEIVLSIKKSWFVLVPTVLWIFFLMFLIYNPKYLGEWVSDYLMLLAIFFFLRFIYVFIERQTNLWIITNFRVIHERGVFSRQTIESPLKKINNVSYIQSFIGRMFNYGTVQIQSAAEKGLMNNKYIEYPEIVKDTISEQIDALEDKQKKQFKELVKPKDDKEENSLSNELAKLQKLKESGALTEEEFKKAKEKLLNQ